MTAVILSNRRIVKPFGINGGGQGANGQNILLKKNNIKAIKLNSSDKITVSRGDKIIIKTPGGGGYGKKATL